MTRLRVALDGRSLQTDSVGGVARYITGTVPLLADDVQLSILVDGRLPPLSAPLDARVETVTLAAPTRVPGLVWLELAVAPWLRQFDGIFHGTFNTLPLSFRGRSVLTLHDLAAQLHPEDFRLSRKLAWRLNIRSSVRRASRITTVSQFTKQQISSYFGISADKILVAPDAADPIFRADRTPSAPALAEQLGIECPYIVALGGASRRALPVAIEAWRRVKGQLRVASLPRHVSLVVVGEPSLASEPGLVSLGFVEDEAWATLLAGAQALCYPTRYEGFGLPALEAAASGTPVVCAPVASLPEVLGDAGCWVSDPSPEAMADGLVRVLTDSEWHRQRREAGLEQARAAPSWKDVAAALLQAYEGAAA